MINREQKTRTLWTLIGAIQAFTKDAWSEEQLALFVEMENDFK